MEIFFFIVFSVKKIEECIQNGYTVVYTMDTHSADYLQTEEGINLPIIHCQKGSDGWQLVKGIYKQNCKIIEKDAFTSLEFLQFVEKNNFTTVEFVGLCTDICILENALLLSKSEKNLSIAVHKNLTAGTTYQKHIEALKTLQTIGVQIL